MAAPFPNTQTFLSSSPVSAAIDAVSPGLSAIAMPACFISVEGRFVVVNAAYAKLLGRDTEMVVGRHVSEVLTPEEYKDVRPYLETALKTGQVAHFSRNATTAQGRQKWVQVHHFPQRLPNGDIYGLIAVVNSAERLKALERETLEREHLLRSLTDRAGLPIIHFDRDMVLRFANQPFFDWLKLSKQDVLGKPLSRVFLAESYAAYLPYAQRALAGETFKIETLSGASIGRGRHVEMAFFPEMASDGAINGAYAMVRDVEEEFQLRQSLIKKELDLRSIADNIAMPISKSDRDLRYQYVNRVACEWFDVSENEVLGKHWSDIVGKRQFGDIHPYAERALAGEIVTYERHAVFPGKSAGHVRINLFPSRDSGGEIDGLYLTITDIEVDHRLREEILAREHRIRLITDNVGVPISYIDVNLRVQFYNKAGYEWLNVTEQDIIGKPMHEAFGQEAVAEVAPYLTEAFNGSRQTYERVARDRAGNKRWVRGHMVPDFDEAGNVVGVFTVLTDIDNDVRLLQHLEEQERQLRLFSDNIPEAIGYLSQDRRYKFVNNTFLRRRGLTREEVIGKTMAEIGGEDAAQVAEPYIARALSGETVVYERLATVMGEDGRLQKRWHRIRSVPDFAADGSVKGIYAVAIDIHDIKTAQQVLLTSEAELRSAIDSMPYPMAYIDKDLKYQFANTPHEKVLGKAQADLVGLPVQQVFSAKQLETLQPVWERVLAGETISRERIVETGNGQHRWMNVHYTPRRNTRGEVLGFYVAMLDIDDVKRAEIEATRTNWMLSSHFENTPLAVIEWDADFCVRRWSPQAEHIFGWKEEEVLGKKLGSWEFIMEYDHDAVMARVGRIHAGTDTHTTSLNRNYRKDGSVIWCEWYNSNLCDESGALVSVLSLAQDVTSRVQAEERLVYQATHDSLTGLPNRTLLQDRLRQAITRARRSHIQVAALFIDLDRFKDVNDTLGHRVGDELLRLMAKRLGAVVRESDILVRLSGDEFMVVLENITQVNAVTNVATKLLAEVSAPSMIEGHEIFVSGSIGISIFPDDADDADALLRHADMAMYLAKESGKNTFRVFSPDLAAHGANMRLLENALRSSVARGELELYYQPKVDMQTNRIIGAEALLRWHHPKRGLVMPGEFIRRAEETGLVHHIGDWVLDAAIAQVRKWHEKGLDLHLAINLSAGQFHASNLSERIIERVQKEGIKPSAIELEITETGMLQDPEGVGRTVSALREFGIGVAIDDFGTGYSSLTHLKRFPIDTLKIDRSFVADVLTDRDDAAIVAAVIALAKALEIDVVAEGVETEAQRAHLASQGCHAYQGYLVSKPVPVKEFEALLIAHNQRH